MYVEQCSDTGSCNCMLPRTMPAIEAWRRLCGHGFSHSPNGVPHNTRKFPSEGLHHQLLSLHFRGSTGVYVVNVVPIKGNLGQPIPPHQRWSLPPMTKRDNGTQVFPFFIVTFNCPRGDIHSPVYVFSRVLVLFKEISLYWLQYTEYGIKETAAPRVQFHIQRPSLYLHSHK